METIRTYHDTENRTKTEGDNVNSTENANATAVSETKNKKRNGLSMMWNGDTEPGDNSRYIRHALVAWNLPPIDISDPQQVQQRITDYFDYCEQNDRKPQLVGMANWLGVSRETLNTWKRGEYRSETHSDIIKKAVDVLEEIWADYMQNGKINPASGIFLGKNFFGYRDVQDLVVTPNNPLESADAETARKKYVDALPESTED
jgi:hypothetical protein